MLGQYRLLHQLGSGGFAPVWLAAEHYGTKELRKVAIKLFAIEGVPVGSAATLREETIIEEAQALCNVEHPNVVRFYTFTKDATNTVLGLVMEYVRGVPLDRRLEERERLPYPEVIELGLAIASALEAVHRVGLVHRDLKPGNVIVSEGVYKLIDFGIASADHLGKPQREQRRIVLDDLPLEVAATKASMLAPKTLGGVCGTDGENPFEALAGTLGYMDPRSVATQGRATSSSDLYALGATLFECAVGMLPAAYAARAAGSFGLKGEILDGRAASPALAVAAPDAPAELASIVDGLLDPDPEKRPQSAVDVLAALSAARTPVARLTSAPRIERPVTANDPSSSVPNTKVAFGSVDAPVAPPRRRWVAIGIGACVSVAAGTIILIATRGGASHSSEGTAPAASSAAYGATLPAAVPSVPPSAPAAASSSPPVASSPSGAVAVHSPTAPRASTFAGGRPTPRPSNAPAAPPALAPAAPAAPPEAPGGVIDKSPY